MNGRRPRRVPMGGTLSGDLAAPGTLPGDVLTRELLMRFAPTRDTLPVEALASPDEVLALAGVVGRTLMSDAVSQQCRMLCRHRVR